MTAEDQVAYSLRDFYLSFPNVEILSFHPPSGKAYDTPLVRFPVLASLAIASRRRHLDFIVRCGRFLLLQELKGDAAASQGDQTKLLALKAELGLDGIVQTIARRIPSIKNGRAIDRVVLSLGFADYNAKIPPLFTTFCVQKSNKVSLEWGSELEESEVAEIKRYFTPP